MPGGTSAWDRLLERRRLAGMTLEEQAINPLGVSIGTFVSLDYPELEDHDFVVVQLRVVTRLIGDERFPEVHYFLRARNIAGESTYRSLRYTPLAEPNPAAGLTHQVLLATLTEEGSHDQDLIDVVMAGEGITEFFETPGWVAGSDQEQWVPRQFPARVNNAEVAYDCEVELLQDPDGDGVVDADEVKLSQHTLWDFWRIVNEPSPRQGKEEFYFIEIDKETAWVQRYSAHEINSESVTTL